MLKANNIHKSYGDLQVLKGITLEVKESEIVSIVGSSGAGKSTLLHILGTLDLPDNGTLSINNEITSDLNQTQLAKFRNEHIGFVFQFHNLLPEFTALENICIPGFLNKAREEEEVRDRAAQLLDMLGLSNRYDHKPSQLSGGEQQRTSVARALINNPGIIFADEPSGNLDSKNAKDLHDILFNLRDKLGQTFVIVTHNNKLAQQSDRFITMKDGMIEV